MNIPSIENALIPAAKIRGYLLNEDHPEGGPKARFFKKHGFSAASLKRLLRKQLSENEPVSSRKTEFGQKFILESPVESPSGKTFRLRAVWIVREANNYPEFVTAHPVSA